MYSLNFYFIRKQWMTLLITRFFPKFFFSLSFIRLPLVKYYCVAVSWILCCVLETMKANRILFCISKSAARRPREAMASLCSAPGSLHVGNCVQFGASQCKRRIYEEEQVQQRNVEIVCGQGCECRGRLRKLGLLNWKMRGLRRIWLLSSAI